MAIDHPVKATAVGSHGRNCNPRHFVRVVPGQNANFAQDRIPDRQHRLVFRPDKEEHKASWGVQISSSVNCPSHRDIFPCNRGYTRSIARRSHLESLKRHLILEKECRPRHPGSPRRPVWGRRRRMKPPRSIPVTSSDRRCEFFLLSPLPHMF
jgi:hypothetical protein